MTVSISTIAALLAWAGFSMLTDEPPRPGAGGRSGASGPQVQAAALPEDAPVKMSGSTEVSGFKITLEGVGPLGDISEQVTRFRPKLANQEKTQGNSNFSSEQFSFGQTFNNANGGGGAAFGTGSVAAGGGGGGMTGGGGAGFGHTFIKPTYGIALKITDTESGGKRDMSRFAQLGTASVIVELDGSTVETEDTGPITTSWPQFDKQFPGTSGLYVARRLGVDVPLKAIRGELKITTGRRVEAVFRGSQRQKKKVGGEEFAIVSVDATADGLVVVASFPPTTAMKRSNNMFERMQAMMSSMGSYELEIEDKEGNVLIPTGASASGGGGGGTQGFSFNGRTQRQSSQTADPELTTLSFRFDAMDRGAIKTITARVVEVEGEPETVPFVIEVQSEQ